MVKRETTKMALNKVKTSVWLSCKFLKCANRRTKSLHRKCKAYRRVKAGVEIQSFSGILLAINTAIHDSSFPCTGCSRYLRYLVQYAVMIQAVVLSLGRGSRLNKMRLQLATETLERERLALEQEKEKKNRSKNKNKTCKNR